MIVMTAIRKGWRMEEQQVPGVGSRACRGPPFLELAGALLALSGHLWRAGKNHDGHHTTRYYE